MPVGHGHPLVPDNTSQTQRCTDQRTDTLGSPGRGEGKLDLGALDAFHTLDRACVASSTICAAAGQSGDVSEIVAFTFASVTSMS